MTTIERYTDLAIPSWSLPYLINNDGDNLTPEEIELCDKWRHEYAAWPLHFLLSVEGGAVFSTMKIKYTTTRETAVILKEWASNCGSALRGNHLASALAAMCQKGRHTPVETFMSGEVEVGVKEATPEAVVSALGPATRRIRPKTMARLAKTIFIQE